MSGISYFAGHSEPLCTYKATVAYDGTAYKGFQLQNPPDKRKITIQGELEACLTTIFNADRRALRVQGAGRTDSGVHARGQVCGNEVVPFLLSLQSTALQLSSDALPQAERRRHGLHGTVHDAQQA